MHTPDYRVQCGLYSFKKFGRVKINISSTSELQDGIVAQTKFQPFDAISFFMGEIAPYDPLRKPSGKCCSEFFMGVMEGGVYSCVGMEMRALHTSCALKFGKCFEKKIGLNIGQMCKDSKDHRINAEFAIFNRDHVPESLLNSALFVDNIQGGRSNANVKIPVIILYAIKAIPRGSEIFATCPSVPRESLGVTQFADDRLSYGLYSYKNFGRANVRHSTIREAGMGLFSETNFAPYDIITIYAGEIYPYHPLGATRSSSEFNFNIGAIQGGIYQCRGLPLTELCLLLSKKLGPSYKEQRGGNLAQICNDPRDGRINAEFFLCNRDDLPKDVISNSIYFHVVDGREIFIETPIICLYALKEIPNGTEIFASYGTNYW